MADDSPHLLPYTLTIRTGDRHEVMFPLHAETRSKAHVAALLTALLDAIDREVTARADVSNGDVLQAAAMLLAARAAMVPAPAQVTRSLSLDLFATAFTALQEGRRSTGPVGRA